MWLLVDLFACTFEDGTCGLIHDLTGNFLWMRYSGKTPTDYTGPSSGQGGSVWYFYVESSDPRQPNDQARSVRGRRGHIGHHWLRMDRHKSKEQNCMPGIKKIKTDYEWINKGMNKWMIQWMNERLKQRMTTKHSETVHCSCATIVYQHSAYIQW